MRNILLILSLVVLLAATVAGGVYIWRSMAEVEIGAHGLTAMILGAVFSLALGGGLMALVFYSSRHGHDEGQHRHWDP